MASSKTSMSAHGRSDATTPSWEAVPSTTTRANFVYSLSVFANCPRLGAEERYVDTPTPNLTRHRA